MRNGWQRTLFGWLYIRDVLSNGVYRGGICGSSEEVFGPPGEKTAPAGGRGGLDIYTYPPHVQYLDKVPYLPSPWRLCSPVFVENAWLCLHGIGRWYGTLIHPHYI